MNLTNQQIEALCQEQKIRHDKKNPIVEQKPTTKEIALAKRYSKLVRSVPHEILRHVGIYPSETTEQIFLRAVTKSKPVKNNVFDYEGFKRKIIIASIESADMVQLKKKLKIDF